MNQILISKYNGNLKFNNESQQVLDKSKIQIISNSNRHHSYSKKRFIILLIFSISIFVLSFCYMIYTLYMDYIKSNMYLSLYNDYDISKLYNIDNSSNTTITQDENIFSIIGIIKIDKIKISYPILSKIDDELLKIAPCKFAGPDEVNSVRKCLYCCS